MEGGKVSIAKKAVVSGIAFALFASVSASAAPIIVTPGSSEFSNPPGENGGGGSSAITGTAPNGAGTGSLELHGDRTRFVLGSIYDPSSKLFDLKSLASFTFDWRVDNSGNQPHFTPALRLHVFDKDTTGALSRMEIIWEGVYRASPMSPRACGTPAAPMISSTSTSARECRPSWGARTRSMAGSPAFS